jgi:alkanesulfonate monooxygenase SsuD/methylene tetrahydromethanopterin reductase-like flavin-dependent oxidoreductase (luciferase family)
MRRPIRFGLNVDPNAGGLEAADRISQIADTNGLELVGVQDHPYNSGFLDTLTLITWLAGRTSNVHFFPNVANLPLRPPAMLAKQAATIDIVSHGRFELGIGAGAFADGIAGMGGPRRSVKEAREALSEAIDILRASWSGKPFHFEGTFYTARAVRPAPRPAHDIGIWLGVRGPKALELLGTRADGWSISAPYVPPAELPELNGIIDAAARRAGRDPESITRSYNVMGLIQDADQDDFNGPVARWTETLVTLYREYRMDTFVYWPSENREQQSRICAEDVVPAVRAAVAAGAPAASPR